MIQATPKAGVSSKPVVTIFGSFGAGTEYVGRQVAAALGLPYHAQAFSSEAIAGDREAVAEQEAALLTKVITVMAGSFDDSEGGDFAETQRLRNELVTDNTRHVLDCAREGGVIVGRNGAVILAERANTVHVLLTGSVADRIIRAAKDAGISVERAAQRLEREDEVRAEMSIVLYGWDPRQPERYGLVLDTSSMSLDAVVEAILDAVRVATAP